MLNGIEYVQVNDANGNVQGAIGTVGGTRFVLPMGTNAKNIMANAPAAGSSNATMIYQDANITLLAVPTADGMRLESTCGSSVQCTGGH